ncbi:hypothetical protein CLV78_10990 [Aliiruegeria haliotis]|uniref:Uncharacterized protein n=1 Tax=Aliiruegeria haliotis TaxID=1280846 RepID=A0A2T0RK29_9RHOB|nr:hypothetical protein CLV78_10990 [Aliiruegeria haliotis]
MLVIIPALCRVGDTLTIGTGNTFRKGGDDQLRFHRDEP